MGKKKLTVVCSFKEFRIVNSFFRHKDVHRFTWQVRNTQSVKDYAIRKEEMSKIIKDVLSIGMQI